MTTPTAAARWKKSERLLNARSCVREIVCEMRLHFNKLWTPGDVETEVLVKLVSKPGKGSRMEGQQVEEVADRAARAIVTNEYE